MYRSSSFGYMNCMPCKYVDRLFTQSRMCLQLHFAGEKEFQSFKPQTDSFVCSVLPQSPYRQVYSSPGLKSLPPIHQLHDDHISNERFP